jgi:GAF domain-containing protein
VKKVRRFREKADPSIKIKARNADPCFADRPVIQADLELESVLFLVERARCIMDDGGDLCRIAHSIKSVITAQLLILENARDRAIVRYSDFDLPDDTVSRFSIPGGLYQRLAEIRFIRLFDGDAEVLKLLSPIGTKLEALIAIPLIRNDRPFGCLAVGSTEPMPFTSKNVLFLAIAAEVISMASGLSNTPG